ncbi:MAG: glycosyltransferase, partial [Bacteroidales bacterium]
PAYYEDTDICFEIRKNGYKVYYQPKSIVIHHEGKTAGIDLQSGYKKFQTINREKFISKWSYELMEQLPNDPKNIFKAANRGIRRNILVIDAFLPFFDRASGSLRLFQIMKMLKEIKFHITFIARNGSMEEYYRPILESMGIEVYAWDPLAMKAAGYIIDSKKSVPYETLLKERKYEFALIEFWDVAEYYLPIIRKYSPETKIIIDTVDIHFVRELREADLKKDELLRENALLRKEREISIYKKADRLWVVTEEDKKAIKDYISQVPIDIIPNIHSLAEKEKNYEDSSDLLFVGNFNHSPNHDAIKYFCREIFPFILKELPEIKLYIIGNNPSEDILSLSSENIIVTGYVKDLSPYLQKARVSVNPLRYGAGMKGKIGEALSWGLPVVTTSIGAEGMDLTDGIDALIADSPWDFASRVVNLYKDKNLWERLSKNGKKKVGSEWSPLAVRGRLEKIFFSREDKRIEKLISIIILVHNQLNYTKMCLESIFKYTDHPYELIIVNNGSTDKTSEFLEGLAKGNQIISGWRIWTDEEGIVKDKRQVNIHCRKKKGWKGKNFCERFKFINCNENLGFAAGNNLGISEAKGDYILLMNNDIVVTPYWLDRLLRVAEMKPEIGIVGPMSNYVSGPQYVKDTNYDYKSLKGLNEFSEDFAKKHEGEAEKFWRIVGFCMLIKREVINKIGGLDEQFGLGNFEDDDFCLRANLAGFESWIAKDCFIHHFGNRTFHAVGLDYNQSLKKNWEIFKKKWGIPRELSCKADFNLEIRGGFSFEKHYYPLVSQKPSISECK